MSGNRIPFLEYSSTFDTLCSSAVSPVEELAKTNAVAARILSVVKSNFPEKFEHNAAHVTPILARYSTPHVNCPSSVSFLPKVSATSEHQNSVLNSFPIHSVIAGPSGAGKSSIVNMISNFIQAGRIMNSQFYGREMQEDLQQLAWGQHDDTVLSLSSDEEEGDDEENDEEDNTKMTIGEFMKKRLQHPDIFHVFKVKATSKEQTVVTQVQSARNGLVVIDEGQRYFLKAQEANDPFARAVLTATDEHKASILFSGGTSILTLGIWRQNGYTQQRVQKGNHRAEYSTCLENGLIRRTHITIISQAPPQIVSEEASCISPSRFKESADRAANFSVPAFSPEPRRPRPSLPTAGAHVAEKSSSKGETIWISDVDSQGEPQEERIELESVAFVINLFWRLLDAKTEMWKKQNHTVLSLFVESTATTNSECERIHREYLRVCETMGVPRAEAERFLPQIKLQKMASELTVGLFGFNIAIKILQGNAELLSYCNHIAKELPPLTSSFNGNRGVKAIIHSALVDKIRAAVEDEWKENVRQTDDQPNLLMHLEDRNSNIYARAIPDNIKPLVFAELKKQVDIMISLFGSADPTPSQHPSTTAIDGRKQMLASSSGPDSSLVQPPVTVMQAKPPAASSVMVMQTKSEIVCLQLLNEAEVASRTEVHSSDIMANNKTVPQFCAVKVLESVSKLLSMNDNSVKRNMENDESYSLEAPVQPTCYNFKKVVPIDTFILPGTRKSKYQKNVNLNNFPKTIQAAYTLLNKIGEMVPIEGALFFNIQHYMFNHASIQRLVIRQTRLILSCGTLQKSHCGNSRRSRLVTDKRARRRPPRSNSAIPLSVITLSMRQN